MVQHGLPPYLECSSRGDRRFSAFYARIKHFGNRTIEELYQSSKVFDDGSYNLSWRQAKGRIPANYDWCKKYYSVLWDWYIYENPDLLLVLRSASGLSDIFGKPGTCCQATELWRIRGGV